MYAKKMDELVKDDATLFMILASINAEGKTAISDLPVVCDFP